MATFTEKELEISNKSYTNKDFEAIYLELIELAEKISTRFSPTSANEADPFIVLLKLVAAISDKINYNVDKNILERFLLSCTQEKSMRDLTEMLGYSMKYYQSAETSVIFKYKFTGKEDEPSSINIPIFSIVTNGDSIQYITTENATITRQQGTSNAVSVIQGKLKELEILGNNVIQLENLNANNRLYLPELMIAENGISVNNRASADAWQSWSASDNLNAETYGTLVYKFGFDSAKNLPYLDFPDWIADIIGDGLSVKYLITDGSAGNIGARNLISVIRGSVDDGISDEEITVINTNAASNGCEPESINESYRNFKKIIGTFDTLVTCRDYANYIYNLLNTYGNPYVSNVQVGDRRVDINHACEVVSASELGIRSKSIVSNYFDAQLTAAQFSERTLTADDINKIFYIYDRNTYYICKQVELENFVPILLSENELRPKITPYDLCIYGLKPISNTSYIAVDDANGYNKSYNLLTNSSDLRTIELNLDNLKSMPHTYKQLEATDIGYIQINYKLDATINTSRKVNILEQNEILINVNNALISKYNPRTLHFGYAIAFDELLETIENADPRIKSVSLQEPEQTPKLILGNNTEATLYDANGDATESFKFIIARNLLSGKVEAFAYDTEFDYSFYQEDARKYSNIIKASTACNIAPFKGVTEEGAEPALSHYKLNENEAIQFLAPKLHTEITYPYGINYYLELGNPDVTFITKNTEYMLQPNDEVIFTYIDSNDNTVIEVYSKKAQVNGKDNPKKDEIYIIKPNFDMYTTAARRSNNETPTLTEVKNSEYTFNTESYAFYTLSTNDTVESKKFVFDHLDMFRRCYWLTNQANNEILWEAEDDGKTFSYVLNDGEYFFYTDTNLTSLYAFGAGTRLRIYSEYGGDNMSSDAWSHNNYISVDAIDLKGLEALGDYFVNKLFDTSTFYLDIYENEIITLTAGDELQILNSDTADFQISNNTFTALPNTIVSVNYKFEGDEEAYTPLADRSTLTIADAAWQVRSILDLNSGPNKPQTLVGNQTISFMPGIYDELTKRYVAYKDIEPDAIGASIDLQQGDTFQTTSSLITSGGENVNLQFMDLDLRYKCPSILLFKQQINSNLQNLGEGFYTTSFGLDPVITTITDEELGTLYNAENQCSLNTSAADIQNIVTEPVVETVIIDEEPEERVIVEATIDIDGEQKITKGSVGYGQFNPAHYFNGKVYYDESDRAYYTLSRTCDNVNTQTDAHDAANADIHTYYWKEISDIYPSTRLFMIYITGIDANTTAKLIANNNANAIRIYNQIQNLDADGYFMSEVMLNNGINIIEVTDDISGIDLNLCDSVTLRVTVNAAESEEAAREQIGKVSTMISQLKLNKGINPNLGIKSSDDIITYIKKNFNQQFKEFFICANLDQAKQIELSEDYKLNSAQAFYDNNNIANKWTLCKIDFPSSNIKIARSSKK